MHMVIKVALLNRASLVTTSFHYSLTEVLDIMYVRQGLISWLVLIENRWCPRIIQHYWHLQASVYIDMIIGHSIVLKKSKHVVTKRTNL